MLFNTSHRKIFIYRDSVDMRKAHNGLSHLVTDHMNLQLLSGAIFLFFAKNKSACKAIVWDGTGLVLVHKKLEKGKFMSFERLDKVNEVSHEDLYRILNGTRINLNPK